MAELTLLLVTEIQYAYDHAFDRPVSLDHKPTYEEVLLIRLRAVAQAQLDLSKRQARK